jgi:WD40 repeat protein
MNAIIAAVAFVVADGKSDSVPKAELEKKTEGHRDGVFSIKAQPGGDMLCSASRDRTVGLWRVGDEKIHRLEGHTNQVLRVAFHPKGTHIASGGADNVIHIWNVATKKSERVLKGHSNWVCDVTFDEKGERLVSAGADGFARIWNVADGKEIAAFKVPGGEVWTAAFLKNGDIVAGGKDGSLRRYAVGSKEPIAVGKGHAKDLYTAILSNADLPATVGADGMVVLYDAQLKPSNSWKAHDSEAYALAFLGDGRLATCGADKTIRVWNVETHREVLRGSAHANAVYGVTAFKNGRLASAGQDRVVHIWSVPPVRIAGSDLIGGLKAR